MTRLEVSSRSAGPPSSADLAWFFFGPKEAQPRRYEVASKR